jgi:hypothetical protein
MLCFICCVRLGCDIYEQVRVVDFSSLLLLLYDSLLANQKLTSLSLPTSLVTISSYAFSSCIVLQTVIIPT